MGADVMKPASSQLGIAILSILLVMMAPTATAGTYPVKSNPYSAEHTLYDGEWDRHELTATPGQSVRYFMRVLTFNACLTLFFIKGHNARLGFQYAEDYSERDCVRTYTNVFPVKSGDGTEFTIAIVAPRRDRITYSLGVGIETTPLGASWALGIASLVAICAVVGGVVVLRRRRRGRSGMPLSAPPSQPPPGPPLAPP